MGASIGCDYWPVNVSTQDRELGRTLESTTALVQHDLSRQTERVLVHDRLTAVHGILPCF